MTYISVLQFADNDFRLRRKTRQTSSRFIRESFLLFSVLHVLGTKTLPTRSFRSWSRCLHNSLVFDPELPDIYRCRVIRAPPSQGTFQIYTNFTLNKFKKFLRIYLSICVIPSPPSNCFALLFDGSTGGGRK